MAMHKKIDKGNVEDISALSSIQEGILFHYLSDPDSSQYVEQLCLTLTGSTDLDKIKETWKTLVKSNEVLRTIFRWKSLDKPMQITLIQHEIPMDVVDLSKEDPEKCIAVLAEIKEQDYQKRIDISEEPFRVTLVMTSGASLT